MPVIALTQEMGSLAKDVALRLAQTCNLAVMRHEVLENVAHRMHVPTSLVKRLRGGKAGLVERLSTDAQQVAIYTAEEVFHLAARGNVVLRGWGTTCVLRDVPHVVRVRVTRPFGDRVQWLMDHLATDDRAFAEAEVRRSDTAHASRMHAMYGVTWGDPLLYDLVVNTGRITVDSAAQMIAQLAARPEFEETEASRAKLQDLALAATVRAALKANESTSGVDVNIESQGGQLVLSGIVVNDHEREETVRVAKAVAGITSVDDQLRVMAITRRFAHSKT